jgi:chemotaxis protein histidine kinase CheA
MAFFPPPGRTAVIFAILLFCLPGRGLAQGSTSSAPAEERSPEFQRYLLAASHLYENLEYERALEQLASARRFAHGVEDDVIIALYEGLILADLGKQEFLAAFKAALFLQPDAKLPVKVSPKVEQDFEAVRAEVRKELAPLLARQAAEKLRKEEERRATELKAQQELAQRQEEARRAAELKAQEAEKQRQEEARRTAELKAQEEARKQAITYRPLMEPSAPAAATMLEAPQRSRPVLPFVLIGAGALAGGAGGYLGMQSRSDIQSARDAGFQSVRGEHLESARSKALLANVLIGTATAAGIGALISFLTSGGDEAPTAEASR